MRLGTKSVMENTVNGYLSTILYVLSYIRVCVCVCFVSFLTLYCLVVRKRQFYFASACIQLPTPYLPYLLISSPVEAVWMSVEKLRKWKSWRKKIQENWIQKTLETPETSAKVSLQNTALHWGGSGTNTAKPRSRNMLSARWSENCSLFQDLNHWIS